MRKLIRQFFFPVLEASSTFALAIVTIVIGAWASDLNVTTDSAFDEIVKAFLSHLFDFSSPVPYFFLALLFSLAGRIEGFINRYKLGQLDDAQLKINALKKELRQEVQSHSESKQNYLKTLESALKYLLTSSETGFDHRCRVTIYRKQQGSEQKLRQIFRHAPNHYFDQNGRIRIPMTEGVVGAAWSNHGEKEVEIDHDPSTEIFRTKMLAEISPEGCSVPNGTLSMPSRHYFARKFEDHESGNRIGIVVYECTEVGVLKNAGMRTVLSVDALDVSRLIKHLGVLQSEFNPAPREE